MFNGRWLATAIGATALFFALTITASAQHVARGILFQVGEKLDTDLAPEGDVDDFVFYGVQGAEISFTLTALTPGFSPTMVLLDADHAVLNTTDHTTVKGSKVKLRAYPLPATGAFFLRVSDPLGRTGRYRIKTKGDLADVPGYPRVTLDPGETYDIVCGAEPGVEVMVKLVPDSRKKTLAVLSVVDPDGEEIPHGVGSFMRRNGGSLQASIITRSSARSSWRDDTDARRIGEYRIRIGGATTTTTVKIKVKVKHRPGGGSRTIASTVPVITSLEPAFGRPGSDLVVHGSNFLPGKVEVLFDGTYGREATYLTPETLAVRAPFGEGEVDITVINSDGQEGMLEDGFIFIPYPPTITNVTPAEGPDSGGTVVSVYGSQMTYVETVTLDDTDLPDPPSILEDWHVQFTTEPMAPGTYAIKLTDRFGQAVSVDASFTFVAPPTLVSLTPSKGGAGRPVTCTGMNFRPDHVVILDGVPTETTYMGPTALGWVTPPGTPGDKITVGVQDIWGRTSMLPDPFEYAYSYGIFDEPFSDSDLEDTEFVPTLGGTAKWNASSDPGKLAATFGANETKVPNPHSSSVSTNVIPLGSGSFANMYNITWYKASDLGSAGTISGFKFFTGTGSLAPNAVMSGFTVKMGHNTSSTGLTTSSPRTANFSGTPVTVINAVSYTLPSSVPTLTAIAYPTFTKTFAYNGKDHLAVDTSKTNTTTAQGWGIYSGYGSETHRVYGYPSTGTTAGGSSTSYYYQCVISFRSDTSMAQSLWFRTESDATEFLDPIVDPDVSEQPTGTEVLVEFQGALENSMTGEPDPLSFTDWTEDTTDLRDNRYIRFRVTFKANLETELGPLLDRIQVPYLYFD